MKHKIFRFFSRTWKLISVFFLMIEAAILAFLESSTLELEAIQNRRSSRALVWDLVRLQKQHLDRCEIFLERMSEYSSGCASAHVKLKDELEKINPLYNEVILASPEGS